MWLVVPKRILVKISWETFKWVSDGNFDYDFMKVLAQKILYLTQEKKVEVVLVSWGGNIFRGGDSKWALDTATGHYLGMMATLMNGVAFGDIIESLWGKVRVLSAIEAPKVVPTFNRKKALRHLEMKRIVIATAGTGNPYCTNDLAAVIRALELWCDMMIKATKVDGVYDKDPKKYPDAQKFDQISLKETYERGLKIMDQSAIGMAMENKLPILVCKVEDIDKIGSNDLKCSMVLPE